TDYTWNEPAEGQVTGVSSDGYTFVWAYSLDTRGNRVIGDLLSAQETGENVFTYDWNNPDYPGMLVVTESMPNGTLVAYYVFSYDSRVDFDTWKLELKINPDGSYLMVTDYYPSGAIRSVEEYTAEDVLVSTNVYADAGARNDFGLIYSKDLAVPDAFGNIRYEYYLESFNVTYGRLRAAYKEDGGRIEYVSYYIGEDRKAEVHEYNSRGELSGKLYYMYEADGNEAGFRKESYVDPFSVTSANPEGNVKGTVQQILDIKRRMDTGELAIHYKKDMSNGKEYWYKWGAPVQRGMWDKELNLFQNVLRLFAKIIDWIFNTNLEFLITGPNRDDHFMLVVYDPLPGFEDNGDPKPQWAALPYISPSSRIRSSLPWDLQGWKQG
ncbi:MAG TPA: hypothetical protein PKZ41_06290, partial [Candidatus Omnitrophota bacterium]|nr:hypothetical protein [Candidatus Omnitrophota bacterium]